MPSRASCGGGRRVKCKRTRETASYSSRSIDTSFSSGRSASSVSSRRSDSSYSSRSSQGSEEGRHYPLFTAEYAKRHGRGNIPFLRLDTSEHNHHNQHHPQPGLWVPDKPRWILYNEYLFLRELGKGTYAKVVLCRSLRSSELCALKIFRNEQAYREAYWDEVGTLEALSRPHKEDILQQQQDYNVNMNAAAIHGSGGSGVQNGESNLILSATIPYDTFGAAAAKSQGRSGRFIVPIAYLPHPVHHAIVFPPLGISLLDLLRHIREACRRAEHDAAAGSQQSKVLSASDTEDAVRQRGGIEVQYRGLPISLVRSVLYQILLFLRHSHRRGIVHTDLKPENVLFETNDTLVTRMHIKKHYYNNTSSRTLEGFEQSQRVMAGGSGSAGASTSFPLSSVLGTMRVSETVVDVRLPVINGVKVIDVGAAEFLSKCRHVSVLDGTTPAFYHRIHTTHYRSVEVILGLGWTSSADMWSLGCMIPELLTGDCVFMPRDDLEHLALMQHIVGGFDAVEGGSQAATAIVQRVFAKGRHFGNFFDTGTLQLLWPPASMTLSPSQRRRRTASLEDLRYVASRPTLQQVLGPFPELCDLCRRLLDYDPLRRITAEEALRHPFFTSAA